MKERFILSVLLILFTFLLHSQEGKKSGWIYLKDDMSTHIKFTKSDTLISISDFTFKAVWKDVLDLPGEEYPYGGISELHIYKGKTRIQTIRNIVDYIDLGYIHSKFFDYNMDGYLDFTIPIGCGKSCYNMYYLYHPKTKMFKHQKEWDYLRIRDFNKAKKQIHSIPDGNAADTQHYLYQVDGYRLIKIKTID